MIYLTMMIFVKDGKEDVFHQYEDKVLPLLKQYNGRLIYRLRPTIQDFITIEEEQPYELHFLSFETEQDFQNFGNDEQRKSFIHLKQNAIKATFLVKGSKI